MYQKVHLASIDFNLHSSITLGQQYARSETTLQSVLFDHHYLATISWKTGTLEEAEA